MGKSWLTTDLALALATGRSWLDTFETVHGDVLIIDNELHPETTSNRIPKVAEARQIPVEEIADHVYVENLRGRLKDILSLGGYFQATPPGRYSVIILDALYRFLPRDTDENDNGTMAGIYNYLDLHAARYGVIF
jgi:RecA-family ATPase